MSIIKGADAETHMCPKRGIMCFSFMCPQIGVHSNVADNNGYVHSCPLAGRNWDNNAYFPFGKSYPRQAAE